MHGFFNPALERLLWYPAQIALNFRGINSVAQVVSRTVGDKSDQVSKVGDVARLLRHHLVENGADGAHHIDIFTLVMTADIVGLAALAFGRHFVQRTGMVLNIQPVTDLLPVAIHRQRFTRQGVEDSQRDQFLRKVIRTIVVGAVSHHHRQAVGAVPGANQMVAARFRGRVRAARRVRGFFGEQVIGAMQVAVHLIGGDVVEAEGLLLRFPKAGPVVTGRFQQSEGADHVGLDESGWAINGTVHMAFCRQVHHDIRAELAELGRHGSSIGDISLGKRVAFAPGHRRQGFKVAGIGQAVHHTDFVPGIFNDMTNHSRADKACTTGDKNLHILFTFDYSCKKKIIAYISISKCSRCNFMGIISKEHFKNKSRNF